jgi:suppressor for copper-sensitivity B
MAGVYLRIFNRMQNRTTLFHGICFSLAILFWSLAGVLFPETSCAQSKKPSLKSAFGDKGFGSLGGLGDTSDQPYTLSAIYTVEKDGLRGRVQLTVSLTDDFYVYSVTQPKGGPLRTAIAVKSDGVELEGPFVPDAPPKTSTNELGFEGIQVEKHFEQVVWTAPVRFSKPIGEAPAELELTVDGQVCKSACIPIDSESVKAEFRGFYVGAAKGNDKIPFRDPGARTSWSIAFAKPLVRPGESTELLLKSQTDRGYHIYAVRPEDMVTDSSTLIVLTQKSSLQAGRPEPNVPPTSKELIAGVLTVHYHEAATTWKISVQVPTTASEGVYPIEGLIGYQACTDVNCEDPLGIKFKGELRVTNSVESSGQEPLPSFTLEKTSYSDVVKAPARLTWIDKLKATAAPVGSSAIIAAPLSQSDLFSKFCLAVLGGFVLNFMPCVLPVIGLKVMSFVKESDRSGASIIALNLWYIAGIMTVFLALAAFTIGFREIQGEAFGWGEQFGSTPLRIGLTVLMFAMALSFLGVWEIPIPGFATSQTSNELMQREGPLGAYSKGLLTTVLATPCSGPGLAAAFAVAISQPAWVIVLMYFGVGLGMSLPFIVICLSPQLIKYVPKPGPWMQSLKEFLAFPMLFAIVWLFLTTFQGEMLIAVIVTLIAVWFACWWIGRVPVWSNFGQKAVHWTGAIATAVSISWFAFRVHSEQNHIIKWIPYSAAQLAELESQNKTVMIDFTAQWCANCKVNLLTAIETKEVSELVDEKGVVPMLADFTDRPPDIKQKLHELQSNSIPILAIFPAGRHDQPIVLRDLVTQSAVVAAIRKATEKVELSTVNDRDHGLPVRVSKQAPP